MGKAVTHVNEREKSTFPKRVRRGSPSPGNCGLTLAQQNRTQTRPRSDHSTHTMDVEQPRLPKLENRGRRSIMADQASNQEERKDEGRGRRSGGSGGAGSPVCLFFFGGGLNPPSRLNPPPFGEKPRKSH